MAINERSGKTLLKRFTRLGMLAIAVVTLQCSDHSTLGVAPTPVAPSPPAANVTLITGTVMDTASRRLADVKAEMVDGPQADASTTTGADGRFYFSGSFAGQITFRLTKMGYADRLQKVTVSTGLEFVLASLAPSVNIAGDYSLTFVADSTCTPILGIPQTGIPEELRSRTYEASITDPFSNSRNPPNTGPYEVKVSGPFLLNLLQVQGCSSSFSIGVAGHDLTIGSACDDPELVEQIDSRTFLMIDAGLTSATAQTSTASTIAATFEGYFDYCVLRSEAEGSYRSCFIPEQAITHSRCQSKNHQMILTRR